MVTIFKRFWLGFLYAVLCFALALGELYIVERSGIDLPYQFAVLIWSIAFLNLYVLISWLLISKRINLARFLSGGGLAGIIVAALISGFSMWTTKSPSRSQLSDVITTFQKTSIELRDVIWPKAGIYWNAWFVGDDNLPDNVLQVAKNYTLKSRTFPRSATRRFGRTLSRWE